VVGLIATTEQLESAVDALTSGGFLASEIEVIHGAAASEKLRKNTGRSGLAHLATRNLISIARFKSNREYERELRRRAHAIPNLPTLFGDTISNFERVWYGTHEATLDLAQQFAGSVDKLKASG